MRYLASWLLILLLTACAGRPAAPATLPPSAAPPVLPGTPVPGGAVLLQDGGCCIGGVVGATVDLRLAFTPPSLPGPAEALRYQRGSVCLEESGLAQTPWQPFAAELRVPVTIATVNWTGLWVSVQFRDAQGHRSTVVCDDISVEGLPAPPGGTP